MMMMRTILLTLLVKFIFRNNFCKVDLDLENSICPAAISKTVNHSRAVHSMNQTHLFGGESHMSMNIMKSPLTGLSSIR